MGDEEQYQMYFDKIEQGEEKRMAGKEIGDEGEDEMENEVTEDGSI